jgi:glycosyl transferase family 21
MLARRAAVTAADSLGAAGHVIPIAGDMGAAARPCYLLPLRWQTDSSGLAELTAYLRQISTTCDVLVVDGSPPQVFARHHCSWAGFARHVAPDPDLAFRNGKVNGVITGIRAAAAERVIIADDDVRYDDRSLAQVLALLEDADIVVPQNYFDPLPWHAAWDSARILLNRGFGMDYPGTLAVRRAAFLSAGCYDGDVLFENLELMRTLRAGGARLAPAPYVLVRRLPPDLRHFAGQRVRQAYDSLAQPARLATELALLPGAALAAVTRHYRLLAGATCTAVALAEVGRRRHGGSAVFPWYLPLLAPVWLSERSVCSWLAVGCRLRGGVRYGGQLLPRAATSARMLRCRSAALGAARSPESYPGM